ncbi:MAG: bifunctional DNA primase/polymerase [Anaeromyxobacteraceae bacterium]
MTVHELVGLDYARFLQHQKLHPISCHGALTVSGSAWCTCPRGFACQNPGKHPVGAGWQRQDREQALALLAEHPDWNIGHVTGTVSRTIILDVDEGVRVVGGQAVTKQGYASLNRLEQQYGPLPATISWITGSGTGGQRAFSIPEGVVTPRNSAGKLAPDIDIRGEGGFGVLPPSTHLSGNRYRWRKGHAPGEIELAPLPETWLNAILALCPTSKPSCPTTRAPVPLPTDAARASAVKRATQYATAMGPAISGQYGHDHTFDVVCRVVERVLTEADAWNVLIDWNATCRPPWSDRELRHKLRDAVRAHVPGALAGSGPPNRRPGRRPVDEDFLARLFREP